MSIKRIETFLKNVVENSEDIYSHDSGIGSAFPTILETSINKEEIELRSFDTILDGQQTTDGRKGVVTYCLVEDLIIGSQ